MTLKEVKVLHAATDLARERIRAKQREDAERRHRKWLAAELARQQRAEKGESYNALLAADVQAGNRRVLAQAARIRHNRRRFVAQSTMVTRARVRGQGTSREHRSRLRRAGGAVRSRDRPRQSDNEEPADHVVRLRLTPELRAFLKQEIDRRVRQGLADQKVRDKALFAAVAAWGEAEVVS